VTISARCEWSGNKTREHFGGREQPRLVILLCSGWMAQLGEWRKFEMKGENKQSEERCEGLTLASEAVENTSTKEAPSQRLQ
jgi:hypothetical protein